MAIMTLTKGMFSSGKPFAQGDVLIWMKKFAPKAILEKRAALKDMRELPLENGMLIVGHSETGHHHVIEAVRERVPVSKAAQALIDGANDMLIELKLAEPCKLLHLRGFDTHEAVILPPGDYIRCIREEQTVQGWQRSLE